MKKENRISMKRRLKELFIDYLVIWAYLFALFGVSMSFYYLVFGEIPVFSEKQAS